MAGKGRTAAYVALWQALRGASRPGAPGVWESLRAVPRLVVATLVGRYPGASRGEIGLLAVAVLYIVSPIDLLPDFLPLLGIVDDAVVASWLAGRLLMDAAAFLRWESEGAPKPGPVVAGKVVRG
ncbi:YkvA family protein [Angustibacter luteus]|uniref:YkvA family protein n=1 Tax=Angustibacter luteus TaxID=658456 RepID=A0ABW1JA78_9ACTN